MKFHETIGNVWHMSKLFTYNGNYKYAKPRPFSYFVHIN